MYHYRIYDLNLISDLSFPQLISCGTECADVAVTASRVSVQLPPHPSDVSFGCGMDIGWLENQTTQPPFSSVGKAEAANPPLQVPIWRVGITLWQMICHLYHIIMKQSWLKQPFPIRSCAGMLHFAPVIRLTVSST